LAGLSANPSIGLNYRNQWLGIQNAYATYGLAYNQYAPSIRSGFGLQVMADVAGNGIYNTFQLGGAYAYDIRFSEDSYIRMGMEGNFVNKRLNWSKLIFLDQIDPMTGAVDGQGNPNPSGEVPPAVASVGYFDAGIGMVVGFPHWHAGFSMKHLNAPREGILNVVGTQANDELPIRYTFHAGGEINLGKGYNKRKSKSFISPNILFVKQRDFYQLNVGGYLRMDQLMGGLWLRHTFTNVDALIFMVGFQKDFFRLSYSYDLTLSRLGVRSGGTHEISLQFQLQSENNKTDYNDCLKIFR
jgi:type IX secretion system PorP/SprF family membrane protein